MEGGYAAYPTLGLKKLGRAVSRKIQSLARETRWENGQLPEDDRFQLPSFLDLVGAPLAAFNTTGFCAVPGRSRLCDALPIIEPNEQTCNPATVLD
jgi:hypothetical protein